MAAEKILNTRILLKNDTLEKWNSSSIILKKGEVALALVEVNQKDPVSGQLVKVPTYLIKVGDGVNTFANLNWTAAMAADVYDWAKKSENEFVQWVNNQIVHPDDTRNEYRFSITEGGKLLIEMQTLYNGENASGEWTQVGEELDFVTPGELTTALGNYYTQGEIDTKFEEIREALEGDIGDIVIPEIELATEGTHTVGKEEYSVSVVKDVEKTAGHTLKETKVAVVTEKGLNKAKDDLLGKEDDDETYYTIYGAHAAAAAAEAAAKKHADDNEKDTKTVVAKSGDYINVSGPSMFVENGTNTYTVSLNESAIKDLIASETTAAMEFKGATATLPTGTLNKGDMYKVSGQIVVAAANDAQGTGFTAKVGDSIVYDGSKWYYIPSGDDIEDTWRPITIGDTEVGDSLHLAAGANVNFATDGMGSFSINACAAEGDYETIEISLEPDENTRVLSVKEGGLKDKHIASDAAIAKSKLASSVQESLGRADTAVQPDNIGTMAGETATDYLKKTEVEAGYKKKQTAVTNKITDAAHVLTSLTQTANGDIAYEVKKLTPADIGAQPEGNYATADQGDKADKAIQSVAATVGSGLKATKSGTAVTINWDTTVTFVFDCGTSTTVL